MSSRFAAFPALLLLAASGAQAATDAYTRTFPVSGRPSVEVRADDASVLITSSDAASVEFRVEYEGYTLSKNLLVTSGQEGNTVKLTARTVGHVGISLGGRSQSVHVEVRMPRDADVRINTGDGPVQLSSIEGTIQVHTGDGAVNATNLSGRVSLNTHDGSIEAKELQGELQLHSGDGAISADRLDGNCEISTGDGKVRVGGRFDSLDIKSGDGSIDAHVLRESKMASAWNIRSGDGSVTLVLPGDFGATLDATTGDGHIHLGLPVNIAGEASKSRVRGAIHGGGPTLSVHTGDGSISIEKS